MESIMSHLLNLLTSVFRTADGRANILSMSWHDPFNNRRVASILSIRYLSGTISSISCHPAHMDNLCLGQAADPDLASDPQPLSFRHPGDRFPKVHLSQLRSGDNLVGRCPLAAGSVDLGKSA